MEQQGLFIVNENPSIPKYRQLINCIVDNIENGTLKRGDQLPSLNRLGELNHLSRDTVMMAFNELKARGIIFSKPGKGYFIQTNLVEKQERIFVLFDEFNSFKEDIYNAFLKHINPETEVDIYFHHFNFRVFSDLINQAAGHYTSYVIMPATFDNAYPVISILPENKVLILDRKKQDLKGYTTLYQDFRQDVIEALSAHEKLLEKYAHFAIIHPGGKEPQERIDGFIEFCNKSKRTFQIMSTIENTTPKINTCYLVISDRDLVALIKKARQKTLVPGKDIGIISFNETMLKEVVGGGITTISTNFVEMGKTLAEMIEFKKTGAIHNPWQFIERASV
ncbi:MAG: GntR family transcriptional regulator [Prolixibacteraceae bacterium]|nr:GntR family transcriptional regulator [Prolixibacteraceae bacterium]